MNTKNIKQKLFSKKIMGVPAFTLAMVAMVGLGSAALLTQYGSITATISVAQSVLLSGNGVLEDGTVTYDADTTAGNTYTSDIYTLINNANVPVTVKLDTTYVPNDGGITTEYQGVLELTSKDTNTWQPTNNKKAKVYYSIVGNTFTYNIVNETNLDLNQYTLIYYKDGVIGLEGRLANPQPAITVSGNIGNLPASDDANAVADYSQTPDYYMHKTGAKLWLVPTSSLSGNTINWANMANFLYETDLISYSANSNNELTLPANGGGVNFEVANTFNPALLGTYTITTQVVPQ